MKDAIFDDSKMLAMKRQDLVFAKLFLDGLVIFDELLKRSCYRRLLRIITLSSYLSKHAQKLRIQVLFI